MFNNHEFCDEEWCWAKSHNNRTLKLLEKHLITDQKDDNIFLLCQEVTPNNNKEVINPIDTNGYKTQTDDVSGKCVLHIRCIYQPNIVSFDKSYIPNIFF